MVRTVLASGADQFRKIKDRAVNSDAIGRIIARIVESQSQRAFIDQKLGEYSWPERYPNQDEPMVNLAALVNHTNDGGQILSRFFDRRPALMGTGALVNSLSATTGSGFLEVGSVLPYAATHQWGGPTVLPITDTAKKTIGRFLGMEKKQDGWKTKKNMGAKQKENREKYWGKLMPLLGKSQLQTMVNQRPFIGITPENDEEIADSIEEYVATGRRE